MKQVFQRKIDWIKSYAQQVILAQDQIDWTTKVEGAIKRTTSQPTALSTAFKEEENKLQELVTLVRENVEAMSAALLMTLNNLIVLNVHTKDVTESLIKSTRTLKTTDFEWQSHMRHYQVESSVKGSEQLDIELSMINSTRQYGFEYLGNQTRLVITPLTDRCYRTLMGALQLNLGGAPEGPAGTGKTETTKDLSKALAKQCVVFNCSDQLDVQTMAKFFKGLACCGAWACFDEFNRIELEILSVIAAQILQIQTALMRRKPNAMFNFEDELILMNAGCAVFITMNPGYAGRSELPDNLKALFRPVAMMIPNYAMIAEISLYSFGFQQARELSVKITQSLKLSSEQLSTQSHYDYGMRAVKSIILAAGVYKNESPAQDEFKLVLKAICDCNLPKFTQEDTSLFNGIISDLFPETQLDEAGYDKLLSLLETTFKQLNLSSTDEMRKKVVQLYDTVRVRHGLMLVGAAMGGKTQAVNCLARTLTALGDRAEIFRINPKSITIGRLYGDFEKVTRDWQDGVLAVTVREATQNKHRSWVMLDGPVDAVWIENLNTVLDDNKKLCLISGEIIKLTPQMTVMFEVEDLSEASPATVSRCGMVYVNPEKLGWRCQIEPWIQTLPEQLKEDNIHEMYRDLINFYLPLVIDFLFGADQSVEEDQRISTLQPIIPTQKNQQVRFFLNFFESLLFGETTTRQQNHSSQDQTPPLMSALAKRLAQKVAQIDEFGEEQVPQSAVAQQSLKLTKSGNKLPYYDIVAPEDLNHVFQLFIVALVWGFGAHLPTSARQQLNHFISSKISNASINTLPFKHRLAQSYFPPENVSLFNLVYQKDAKSEQWSWVKLEANLDKYDLKGDLITHSKPKNEPEIEGEDSESSPQLQAFDETPEIEFHNIIVVTPETLKVKYYLETLLQHSFPVLLLGETGTGKTSVIKKLMHQITKGPWETGEMVLSATSSAKSIQLYCESKLEKHKKGVYGPKNPSNRLLFFVDDLNMPIKEKYGAQPPLEMLRQIIDMGGFYNQKTNQWAQVTSSIFVGSMGLPGGGRTLPSQRLLRHFNLLYTPEFEKESLRLIFTKILTWGFSQHPDTWKGQISLVVLETIELFYRAVATLLPLPGKSHYKFNLRQASEIIQGILFMPEDVVTKSADSTFLLRRLWVHESMRVYSDRLISQVDKKIFLDQCLSPARFYSENATDLVFCNFVEFNPVQSTYQEVSDMVQIRQSLEKIVEMYNQGKLASQRLSIFMFDYMIQHLARISRVISKPAQGHSLLIGLGGNGRKTVTKLGAFVNDAQIFRIEPSKSYGTPEWQEDLRTLFKFMGLENRKMIFLLQDSDLRQEQFVEDVNNLLNVGELTNLFTEEDLEEISYELEGQLKKMKAKGQPFDIFLKRCKRNLHIILLMSPAGRYLEQMMRKYPSLVNCTSIDWFLNWPNEALLAVSDYYLAPTQEIISGFVEDIDIEDAQESATKNAPEKEKKYKIESLDRIVEDEVLEAQEDPEQKRPPTASVQVLNLENEVVSSVMSSPVDSDNFQEKNSKFQSLDKDQFDSVKEASLDLTHMSLKDRISHAFVRIHQSVIQQAERYFTERKRQVYVTPSSFFRLFPKFSELLNQKQAKINDEISKFEQGITKLDQAKVLIDMMQEKLEALKPVLEVKSRQVDQILLKLNRESKEVMAMKALVDLETEAVEQQKSVAEEIKNQCLERLSEAQPHFERAIKALKTLTTNDFVIIKSFTKPPDGVKLALEACCIMLAIQPDLVRLGGTGPKVPDYWEKSKKLIKDYKKLISRLENYDKNNINPATMAKIQQYLENQSFNPEIIKNASNAAEGICKWVIAICQYDGVYKEIQPKRDALAAAESELTVVQAKLDIKLDELKRIMEKNALLQAEYQVQLGEKQSLVNQRDEAQKKLSRASMLMQSIGSEKDRWITTKQKLQNDRKTILGDLVLGTCFVTYLGLFEGHYREVMMNDVWRNIMEQLHIQHTVFLSIRNLLGNEEVVAAQILKGLPADTVSIENMIILKETSLSYLIVDPEGQALRYFKRHFEDQDRDHEVITVKINQPNAHFMIEQSIVSGREILILNCGHVTHPSLVAIIKKEIQVVNGLKYLKMQDLQIDYDEQFKPYIFTQLDNPDLSPAIQQNAAIVNFMVTSEGLDEQLLSIVCQYESQKDEIEREKLARQSLEYTKQRRLYMDQILEMLRSSGQDILESDDFVNTMEESRKITSDITNKLAATRHIEERIEENRKMLRPVAQQASRLFFAVKSLSSIEPMYQYSMNWYRSLFESMFKQAHAETTVQKKEEESKQAVNQTKRKAPPNQEVKQHKEIKTVRVNQLKQQFSELLYQQVQLGLFESHKLLFAFYMVLKINEPRNTIESNNFAAKLKELERQTGSSELKSNMKKSIQGLKLQEQTSQHSKLEIHRLVAAPPQVTKKPLPVVVQGSRASFSRKSDSVSGENPLQAQANLLMLVREEERRKVDQELLKYLLTGLLSQNMQPYSDMDNPDPEVFSATMWSEVKQLTAFECFENLQEDILRNLTNWQRFMRVQNLEALPEPYLTALSHFAWIPLVRVLKPELTTQAIRRLVRKSLGAYFVTPQITQLRNVFEFTSPQTPILLILTPGNDPMEQIKKLCDEKQRTAYPVSLGKGQGEKAKLCISEGRKYGGWVVLQNCHLGSSFLPELEQIVESLEVKQKEEDFYSNKKGEEPPHTDFRLFLTSMSIEEFPLTVLQKSIKVTSEPPKGIKSSLVRTYTQIVFNKTELEFYDSCRKQEIWQPMFFALSFFHAIVRERRRYGNLGWNLPTYDFNDSDFKVSSRQLYNMIENNEEIPFKALSYLCGECNYGGRVTDDQDRRALTTILTDFYNTDVINTNPFQFTKRSELQAYSIVKLERAKEYLEFCNKLPDAEEESPYLVGLHQNASIIQSKADASQIFAAVLRLDQQKNTPTKGRQAVLQQMIADIQSQLKDQFKIKEVELAYPFRYEESMNGVLLQELARYNSLLKTIHLSLQSLQRTLEGKIVTTAEMEQLQYSIQNNQVPQSWLQKSYPSKKPLVAYVQDLNLRLSMFDDWIVQGAPGVFWISGFFFTHSFLAGVKQNFARAFKHPFDRVDFEFLVLKQDSQERSHSESPKLGSLIEGLYLEGAGWDPVNDHLCESALKVIHVRMPVIHLIPVVNKVTPQDAYPCPTYVTSQRSGTLSTTGHSTNFIMMVELACGKTNNAQSNELQNSAVHWVKRSVALLSQLDY